MTKGFRVPNLALCLLVALSCTALNSSLGEETGAGARHELRRPDEKNPEASKRIKVFILMGQSNMVGMGELEPETTLGTLAYLTRKKGRYPWLVDDRGKWTARKDVYYYDARLKKGSPLSPTSNNGKTIGPELGFGYVMGQVLDEPVLVLKTCIGNRSLGWDLLPPGSERFTVEGRTYAGYKDTPESWVEGQPKKQVNWYAGKQYDEDVANAKAALKNLATSYPGYYGQGYEVTGFVWWQGHKDQNPVHAGRYEQNLVRLIKSLRADFESPDAKFVLATIAFNGWKLSGPGLTIANAQIAVGDQKRHPEFAGSVKTVEARDYWRDAAVSPNPKQGYHYNRNAETYLEVGTALGWVMADLLGKPN